MVVRTRCRNAVMPCVVDASSVQDCVRPTRVGRVMGSLACLFVGNGAFVERGERADRGWIQSGATPVDR